MQQTLTYRFDPDDDGDLEAIRITVKTLTIKRIGDHARMIEGIQNQWNADHDIPADDPNQAANTSRADQVYLYQYKRWVTCFVATSRVEIIKRTKKLVLDDENPEGWTWEQSSLLAIGLDKPEGVLELKSDLLDAWELSAMNVNPGLFGGQPLTSQAKKKTGLLNVT